MKPSGIWILVLLTGLALAATATAQPYGTDLISSHGSGTLVRTTPAGVNTTFATGLGNGGLFNMVTVDSDNKMIVVLDTINRAPATNQLLRVDPVISAVVATIWKGAPLSLVQSWLEVDQDGDYIVADGTSSATASHLFKIKRDGSSVHTLFSLPGGYFFSFTEDKISGDWIIGDLSRKLYHVDRNLGTLVTTVPLPAAATGMMQDPALPDILISGSPGILAYHPTNLSLRTVVNQSGFSPNCMTLDRAPGVKGALIYTGDARPVSGQISRFDRKGVNLGALTNTGQRSCLGLTFDRGRNLAPVLITPPNDRFIKVSFPGDAGKAFVLALSLLGCKPGVTLPDGRVLPLNPDFLTSITATGSIPTILTGNIGILDPFSEATVRLNANPLGLAAKGLRVWAAAVTLDPKAPSGISQVAPPLLFVLN